MSVLRVALCADFPEEQWPSMDRVANELAAQVQRSHGDAIDLTRICPPFERRAMSIWPAAASFAADRALNRWWDYPRHLAPIAAAYDVFHVIDHSYAHLVHHLPAGRTVVTCHDLDTFRSILRPAEEKRSAIFRIATRRILSGLQRAAWVTCDTAAMRDELLDYDLVPADRLSVAPIGVGEAFSSDPDELADAAALRIVAPAPRAVEILHVGSTIPRKRVETLLEICATLVPSVPDLHLVRVGGPFTARQQAMVQELGLTDRISVVGFLNERTLAALYRRAAMVLLPSEREGFGLPLLEAIACGTPVVASDLAVLREVGGSAVEYCAAGDIASWVRTAGALLDERHHDPARWLARRNAGRLRARCFSWDRCAKAMTQVYERLG
jgi:glycosyltransferase involved in cell wall biosynthesis